MKAEDIKNSNDLKAWLNSLPDDQIRAASRFIANRAALRVLPIWAQHFAQDQKHDFVAIQLLRCVIASSDHHGSYGLQNRKDGFGITHKVVNSVKAASDAALDAFDAACAVNPRDAASRAVATSAAAAYAVTRYSDETTAAEVYDLSYSDARAINSEKDLSELTLWRNGDHPFDSTWSKARPLLDRHRAWTVLEDLYENALHARPQNWPLLTALAQKDEVFWTGTDTEVLDRIAEVMDNFERLRLLGETHSIKGLIEQALPDGAASAFQRSHNNPPELIENADPPQQVLIIWAGLDQVEHELTKAKPDKALLAEIAGWVKRAFFAILKKCADWADKGVSAFTIAFGTGLAGIVLNKLFVSGRLAEYIEQLINFASGG